MKTKTITVELDEKTIEVKKLPIGKYSELLRVITELPKQLKELFTEKQSITNEQLIERIPSFIATALPDIINVVVVATEGQLTKEEVEAFGLDEITKVLLAIIEVNNYSDIYNRVKKALARPAM